MRALWIVVFGLAAIAAAAQNQQGAPAIYTTTGGVIGPSTVWLDASQFNSGDLCKGIQSAIASLPAAAATTGIVIDARNYPTSTTLACSVNPFAVGTNPLQLVYGGTGTSQGSGGGLVLLPGATISVSVPWIVPGNWSILGEGAGSTVGTILKASFTVPARTGTSFATTQGSSTVSATGASWGPGNVGLVLLVCATNACSASPTNAQVVGIITAYSSATHNLSLGTAAQVTTAAPNNGYIFQAPILAWATTSSCTGGGCTGALQTNTFGSVIQDLGLNCSSVTNCIPFWDQYGQERSQLKRIEITGFSGIGIGIYTSSAQNGGPFDDVQMAPGNTATCVEVGGTGVGGGPTMRGIRGLTCTGSGSGTGVDINTQNFSLADAHFESLTTGVEVGDFTAAEGISISDISGGGSASAVGTIVDISSACATSTPSACNSLMTSDVKVADVYSPYLPTTQRALIDHISGNTTNEAVLGFYSLGDGSGLTSSSTRPVLTTSSTFGSSPNLHGMTAGTPVTGVQGSTGTLVQMSSGSAFTSGDLLQSDSHSNTADSGIAGANIANTVEFFTSAFGLATNNSLANTTIKLWGFSLPNAIATSAILLDLSTTDNSANLYSLGIYSSSGTLMVSIGPTAGSTLFGAGTGSKNISWSSGATLTPGKYYFATATNCASSCAALGGTTSGTFASAAAGGTAAGGALPGSVTPPADSWAITAVPSFTIH